MTPNAIRAELVRRGIRQTHLARALGVTSQAVNHVPAGRSRTPRIREAIARALALPVSEIWSDRGTLTEYSAPGHRSNG